MSDIAIVTNCNCILDSVIKYYLSKRNSILTWFINSSPNPEIFKLIQKCNHIYQSKQSIGIITDLQTISSPSHICFRKLLETFYQGNKKTFLMGGYHVNFCFFFCFCIFLFFLLLFFITFGLHFLFGFVFGFDFFFAGLDFVFSFFCL